MPRPCREHRPPGRTHKQKHEKTCHVHVPSMNEREREREVDDDDDDDDDDGDEDDGDEDLPHLSRASPTPLPRLSRASPAPLPPPRSRNTDCRASNEWMGSALLDFPKPRPAPRIKHVHNSRKPCPMSKANNGSPVCAHDRTNPSPGSAVAPLHNKHPPTVPACPNQGPNPTTRPPNPRALRAR